MKGLFFSGRRKQIKSRVTIIENLAWADFNKLSRKYLDWSSYRSRSEGQVPEGGVDVAQDMFSEQLLHIHYSLWCAEKITESDVSKLLPGNEGGEPVKYNPPRIIFTRAKVNWLFKLKMKACDIEIVSAQNLAKLANFDFDKLSKSSAMNYDLHHKEGSYEYAPIK